MLYNFRWICIYPAYINSRKTVKEGRRIPKDKVFLWWLLLLVIAFIIYNIALFSTLEQTHCAHMGFYITS